MHARGLMQAITTVIIRNLLLNNSKKKKKKIRAQIFSNQMYDKLRKLTEKNLYLDEYLSLVLFSSSHLGFLSNMASVVTVRSDVKITDMFRIPLGNVLIRYPLILFMSRDYFSPFCIEALLMNCCVKILF